ncbi:MAG TPA: ribosome maturation factor RimM [Solirubrobacteraceae bacterium]|nr:ribosome maturation factor RimM [Solirubrobacteraceae bacterium]
MSRPLGDGPAAGAADRPALSAGRVGRPHGLDGGFYVTGARARLLTVGTPLELGDLATRIRARLGTDERPIIRVQGIEDRDGAEALRGREISVATLDAPALQEGEWWASELEGCEVSDGERRVGVVVRLVELPSCEALEVRPAPVMEAAPADESRGFAGRECAGAGGEDTLLIPMVHDAIRSVDVGAGRIDVDLDFVTG